MATQELMLNDNVNLNLQYNNRVFKLKVNLKNGLLLLGEMQVDNDDFNLLSVMDLATIQNKTYNIVATKPREEVKEIEDKKEKEETNGRSRKHKRRKN